jgi:hypothetical protein
MDSKHGPKDIENVGNILHFIVNNQDIKLAFGTRKRDEMRDKLKKGIQPNDYRASWLMSARSEMVNTLEKLGTVFNKRFPHDCASVQDFVDILQSTMNQLVNVANKKTGKKG